MFTSKIYKIKVDGDNSLLKLNDFLKYIGFSSLTSFELNSVIERMDNASDPCDCNQFKGFVYVSRNAYTIDPNGTYENKTRKKYRLKPISVDEFKKQIGKFFAEKESLFNRFDAYIKSIGLNDFKLDFSSLDNNGYIYFDKKHHTDIRIQISIQSSRGIGRNLTWNKIKELKGLEYLYILVIKGEASILFEGSLSMYF